MNGYGLFGGLLKNPAPQLPESQTEVPPEAALDADMMLKIMDWTGCDVLTAWQRWQQCKNDAVANLIIPENPYTVH